MWVSQEGNAPVMRSKRGAERPQHAEDAVSLRSAEAVPLRLPIVRPANDDELLLTQNSQMDFADNGNIARYHYCWRDGVDDKMFQENAEYSPHRLINSI